MHARNRTWPLGYDPAERCRQRTMPVGGGDGSTYDGQNAAFSGYSYVLNGQTAGFAAYTDQFNAGNANNNE